jgi:hypothetical protein
MAAAFGVGMTYRKRLHSLTIVVVAAAIHAATFLTLWATEFARFESVGAGHYTPGVLNVATNVLAFPVFLAVRPEWTFWLRPYLGDDSRILILLAALNALCWGVAVLVVVRWRQGGREGFGVPAI